MPNWCSNHLEISGNKEVIEKIKKGIHNNDGLFKLFYPVPEELNYTVGYPPSKTDEQIAELVKKYGATDWYDWSIKNWGCKWDARDIEIEESGDDNLLYLIFNTPWSPPIGFYNKFAKEYKLEMLATYTEESMDFCGRFKSSVVRGEVVIDDTCYDTGHLQKEVLSLYAEQNKDKQVTADEFYNELHSIYFKSYPEIGDFYDSEEMFNEFWLEDRLEDKEFCKQYGIINKTIT
tara:strand:- start:2206 stop:2904 length:699 start_codon:yes stop_codon:yes gene_type:complete